MIALLAAARRVRMALSTKAKEGARATAAATVTATATAATAAIIAAAEQGAVKALTAQVKAGAGAGSQVRAQVGAQTQAARQAEDRMLDRLEAQCSTEGADIGMLKDEAAKVTNRAEQSEYRATVVQCAQGREVRDLELDADFGRIMSGRLEGQLAVERQVCLLRHERLDAALALDRDRADRAELSIAMVWECLEREKENVEKLTIEKDALDKENFVKQTRLLADEALRHAAEIGCTRSSADGAAGVGAAAATMAAANRDTKEALWLESPARTDSSAELGVSDDGTEEAEQEEEEEEEGGQEEEEVVEEEEEKPRKESAAVASGGTPTTPRKQQLERQQSAKEKEIRRNFLESRRQRFGEFTDFVPAVSLPVQCSLSPTSNSLQRGPLLSEGQFGAVTLVRHAFGRFALKEVAPRSSKGGRDAAKHEMQVLLSLKSHPHVITLKGLDDTIPTMPILLELAVCDAFEILENGHRHSMLQKSSLLRDAASGLLHIHSAGWVHVDFKAENLLMVKGHGRLLQGKVSDFGLARLEGDVRPKMTGTPGYIPMENLTEAVATSADQDVFSLAIFMLMMFVLPHLQGNNVFALEVLLTDDELDELNSMEEGDMAADIAFDSRVMQRTSVDGSFEREILKASSLQGSVPLAEEVCEWLKACLSADVSARLSMPDLASNLNRLVQRTRNRVAR